MMQSLSQRFASLDPKVRWALLAALLLFVLLEVWLLGLRGPWQQWRKAQAERQSQAQMVAPDLGSDIAEARNTLAALQAQAEAMKSAHLPERLNAWRNPLQRQAEQHHVTLEGLTATEVAGGLPRISLALKGRYADVLAVQHSLASLDMPLLPTRWTAQVQADGSLAVRIDAVPSASAPASASLPAPPSHDPFGSVRVTAQRSDAVEDSPPKLRALVAAGPRSMVVVGDQVVEIGGLIQGYRLIAVREDRALFVKQGRHVTAVLDTPASP